MSSIEYSINFTEATIGYIIRKGDKYEGKIILTIAGLVGEVITKPQPREWWIEMAEKVGGEFEKAVKLLI